MKLNRILTAGLLVTSANTLASNYVTGSQGDTWTYSGGATSEITEASGNWKKFSDFANMGEMWIYSTNDSGYVYFYTPEAGTQVLANFDEAVGSEFTIPESMCDEGSLKITAKNTSIETNAGSFSDTVTLSCGNHETVLANNVGVVKQFDTQPQCFTTPCLPLHETLDSASVNGGTFPVGGSSVVAPSDSDVSISESNEYVSPGEVNTYSIEVPENASSVTTSITWTSESSTADVILYLKHGSAANASNYDCQETVAYQGTCTIANPESGTWHIGVEAYQSHNYGIEAYATAGDNNNNNNSSETGVSALNSGESANGSVSQGDWTYYSIEATNLNVVMSNLSADVDLYVRQGAKPTSSSYDCRPYVGGTTSESCEVTSDSAVTWYIGVQGYSAGSFTMTATASSQTNDNSDDSTVTLESGQSVDGSVARGDWVYYSIEATNLNVVMSNLSADVDLYVRQGAKPTSSSYDCRPYVGGTKSETCDVNADSSATWYIGVQGYSAGTFTMTAKKQ